MPSTLNIEYPLAPPVFLPISSLGRWTESCLSPLSEGDLTFRQFVKRVCNFCFKREKRTKEKNRRKNKVRERGDECLGFDVFFFLLKKTYQNSTGQRNLAKKTTRLRITLLESINAQITKR